MLAGEKARRRDSNLFSYTGLACPDFRKVQLDCTTCQYMFCLVCLCCHGWPMQGLHMLSRPVMFAYAFCSHSFGAAASIQLESQPVLGWGGFMLTAALSIPLCRAPASVVMPAHSLMVCLSAGYTQVATELNSARTLQTAPGVCASLHMPSVNCALLMTVTFHYQT